MSVHLSNTPLITTERLILTAPRAGDWTAVRDYVLSERSRFTRLDDASEGTAWRAFCHIIGMWVARGYGPLVFRQIDSGRALGMAGPWHPVDWPEREIAWSIWAPEMEGKGIAFEAARAARDWAFDDLGWDTAVSYIDAENARSIRLAERLGARPDATAARPDDGAPPVLVFRHDRDPAEGRAVVRAADHEGAA